MNFSWIYILIVMFAGDMVIRMMPILPVVLLVRFGVVVIGYFILRRDPFIDLRSSMMFLLGLTGLNILVDFGILGGMLANLAYIVLLVWSMSGGGRSR